MHDAAALYASLARNLEEDNGSDGEEEGGIVDGEEEDVD